MAGAEWPPTLMLNITNPQSKQKKKGEEIDISIETEVKSVEEILSEANDAKRSFCEM